MNWLIPFCFAVSVAAQDLGSFSNIPFLANTLLSQTTIGATNFLPGMMEEWEFTNNSVTTNASVTNWIGQIQGTILTNGASANRPTNSSSGIGITGGTIGLTNLPLVVNTNWFITEYFECTTNTAINANIPLWGQYNGKYNFQLTYGGNNVGQFQIYTASGQQDGGSAGQSIHIPQGIFMDVELYSSNNVNGGAGKRYIWTNGIFMSALTTGDTLSETNSFIGYNPIASFGGSFAGYYQALYIQTNFNGNANNNASNAHYWRTNYLTKGASP